MLAAPACSATPSPSVSKLPPRAPKGFFGIGPQTSLTDRDAEYMRAGGVEAVRWPVSWAGVQPTRNGPYDWSAFDATVAVAARHGLTVLPFLLETPKWVARKGTTLPINSAKARRAWKLFLAAAVKRYGPGGDFWAEHAPGAVRYEPAIRRPKPIRTWQIWNEANFHYFAYPVSPQRYARLLKLSAPVIKRLDPGAKVIMSGLFAKPAPKRPRGMLAARFLAAIYRIPGMKRYFDGIALHPYAVDTESLEELTEEFHDVAVENHDRVPLYITEMGWGSEDNFEQVAFEQGIRGQVKQLRGAYSYLLTNRAKLGLRQVYWFTWKDVEGSCTFCDSTGLFRMGPQFKPKPAWRAFVRITRGRPRP